jgi:hypothetical protein
MFIPYNTDAPIYHYPFATGGLIAANVLLFYGTTFQDPELVRYGHLMIEFGTINPVQSGELMAACAVYKRHQAAFAEGKGLENATLSALVPALQKLKQWELVIPLQVEWLRRLPAERSTPLRLNLAQILLQISERPRQAIAVLDKLPAMLTAEQKQKAVAIRRAAEKALAAGNYEIDVFDW